MLAQSGGHSVYDRITWGSLPKFLAIATAIVAVGVLGYIVIEDRPSVPRVPAATVAETAETSAPGSPLLAEAHTANLGRELFSKHLVSVELAGTLLLAALVGAVAIAIHGNPQRAPLGESRR
jgi:NADH:ubiquinone oxidoreductase subunit 6 (subunit J)